MLGILDRQRYWAFFKAYVICYVSLVGLYVVIDAFANLDEFYKRAEGVELFRIMGRYYLVHQSQFFDQLCGVIGMMAAIFTVTWMQRNNEQLAMLAAGMFEYNFGDSEFLMLFLILVTLPFAAAVPRQT